MKRKAPKWVVFAAFMLLVLFIVTMWKVESNPAVIAREEGYRRIHEAEMRRLQEDRSLK